MYRRQIATLFAIPLLAAACSTSSGSPAASSAGTSTAPGASQPAASQPAASQPAASQGGGGGGLASLDLTITGGANAGHYQVDITAGGCSTGAVGPGTFAVASSAITPTSAFDGPQITVYDAAAAQAGGTDSQFSAAFTFNNYASAVEVNPYLSASTGQNFGSGTANLTISGSTATLTIEGTTSANEQVSATIECHSVTNL